MNAYLANRNDEIKDLNIANNELHDRLVNVERKLNELEQYSRRENNALSGLSANVAAVAMAADVNDPMAETATSVVGNLVSFGNDCTESACYIIILIIQIIYKLV